MAVTAAGIALGWIGNLIDGGAGLSEEAELCCLLRASVNLKMPGPSEFWSMAVDILLTVGSAGERAMTGPLGTSGN